jgi:hypothetical protein
MPVEQFCPQHKDCVVSSLDGKMVTCECVARVGRGPCLTSLCLFLS